MKDDKDKENDIEMNDGDSAEAPADENNMQANPESEKKPHNRKVIAAICGLALVALIGGGAYYGISHQTGAGSKVCEKNVKMIFFHYFQRIFSILRKCCS